MSVEYESPAIAKLLQAGNHFLSLEQEVERWNNENTLLAPTKASITNPNGLELFMPTEPVPPLLLWSARFGDGVHNLRVALDRLAFEVCHLEGTMPTKPNSIYFPIAEEESRWEDKVRHLGTIPRSILARMREVQPWYRAVPRAHPLSLIHAMDIVDKHKTAVDLIVLPFGLHPEKLLQWPSGKNIEDAWSRPWIQISYDVPIPDVDLSSALWDINLAPMVLFEGRMAFMVHVQRWLYQSTSDIVEFIASGKWPERTDGVPEPDWAEIP